MEGPEDFACDCLQVTEAEARAAVRRLGIADLGSLMARTGAGTGCTCCHPALKSLVREERERLAYFSAEPICSAR